MKLEDALWLLTRSVDRLVRLNMVQNNPRGDKRPAVTGAVMRKESWINFKRSCDVLRMMWFVDPRTRISARKTLRRLFRRK